MSKNQFFEKKGPFPLSEIIKIIGCTGNFSQTNNETFQKRNSYRFSYNFSPGFTWSFLPQ